MGVQVGGRLEALERPDGQRHQVRGHARRRGEPERVTPRRRPRRVGDEAAVRERRVGGIDDRRNGEAGLEGGLVEAGQDPAGIDWLELCRRTHPPVRPANGEQAPHGRGEMAEVVEVQPQGTKGQACRRGEGDRLVGETDGDLRPHDAVGGQREDGTAEVQIDLVEDDLRRRLVHPELDGQVPGERPGWQPHVERQLVMERDDVGGQVLGRGGRGVQQGGERQAPCQPMGRAGLRAPGRRRRRGGRQAHLVLVAPRPTTGTFSVIDRPSRMASIVAVLPIRESASSLNSWDSASTFWPLKATITSPGRRPAS